MWKFAAVASCAALTASAQEYRASLNGVLTDAQGAVVPGTSVSVVQVDTKATFSTVTSAVGQYIVPLLPLGQGITYTNPIVVSPYTERWTFTFQHQIQNNLVFEVGYMGSRSLHLVRTVSGSDRPYKFVFTGSYELPVGRGKALAAHAGTFMNRVLGGWKAACTLTTEGQGPLGWGNVIYNGGDLRYDPRNIDSSFDTTRFDIISAQQLVNNIHTFPAAFSNLRPDKLFNLDAAVSKDVPVKEHVKMQLRFEAFNSLNRPQFSGRSLTPTSATFGKITSQADNRSCGKRHYLA